MPRSPPLSETSPPQLTQPPTSTSSSAQGRQNSSYDGPAPLSLPPVASITGYVPGLTTVTSSADTGSPQGFRNLGMQSILNPTSEHDFAQQPQRISQSPRRNATIAAELSQTPMMSPRIRKRNEARSPTRGGQHQPESRSARRLLTPKSPALRALSQGTRRSPSARNLRGTSAVPNEPRVYTAEPGESPSGRVPPLPAMTPGQQYATAPGMQSYDYTSGLSYAPGSYANSVTSYSANTQGLTASPSGSSNIAEREVPSPFRPPQRSYGPSQPAYQMELQTDAGATMIVPVEVDTQQASKLADEKRKRNAGASARFRQRRKEKEQLASQNISELQKQMRDLTEERDYYMAETNYLRDVLARTPGIILPARAPSPRARRAQGRQYGPKESESHSNPDYAHRDTGEPPAAQRRRTSDFQPSFAPAHTTSPGFTQHLPPPAAPSYALPPPSGPPGLPDPRLHGGASQYPGQQSIPPASNIARPPTYDPFRRDINR